MPTTEEIYDDVIRQSQENVKALSEKLKALDKLHEDIIKLKDDNNKLPKFFDDKFEEMANLTEDYTKKLGASTTEYLQKNNQLFTTNIDELSSKTKLFRQEVERLETINLEQAFKTLQDKTLERITATIDSEISKFRNQTGQLEEEITRLQNIDLETHFDALQKTLSDIFGAINSLNTSFTTIIQTLNAIVQSNSEIQSKADKSVNEIKSDIAALTNEFETRAQQQNDEIVKNRKLFENTIKSLADENKSLKKGVKTNRLIGIIGIVLIISLLVLNYFMR